MMYAGVLLYLCFLNANQNNNADAIINLSNLEDKKKYLIKAISSYQDSQKTIFSIGDCLHYKATIDGKKYDVYVSHDYFLIKGDMQVIAVKPDLAFSLVRDNPTKNYALAGMTRNPTGDNIRSILKGTGGLSYDIFPLRNFKIISELPSPYPLNLIKTFKAPNIDLIGISVLKNGNLDVDFKINPPPEDPQYPIRGAGGYLSVTLTKSKLDLVRSSNTSDFGKGKMVVSHDIVYFNNFDPRPNYSPIKEIIEKTNGGNINRTRVIKFEDYKLDDIDQAWLTLPYYNLPDIDLDDNSGMLKVCLVVIVLLFPFLGYVYWRITRAKA